MIKYFYYINTFIIFLIKFSLLYAIEAPKNLFINDIETSNLNLEVELNDILHVYYEGWVFDKSINTDDYCSAKGNKFDSSNKKPFRSRPPEVFTFKIGNAKAKIIKPSWL